MLQGGSLKGFRSFTLDSESVQTTLNQMQRDTLKKYGITGIFSSADIVPDHNMSIFTVLI